MDPVALAWQYERDVLRGREPACKWVKLACQRNVRDKARIGKRGWSYRFDEARARRACARLSMLPHIKGSQFAKRVGYWPDGSVRWATLTLGPWQAWLVCCLFGWVHVKTGYRRFRTALVMVPRKNGKSMLASGILLLLFACDDEAGADCVSAATKRDQAAIVVDTAIAMVRREPQFQTFYGIQDYRQHLEIEATSSTLRALSADANTLDGLNPHGVAIDELHAHKTRAVWDVLETAEGSRTQPLLFAISTAGNNIGGICYEQLTYLRKVLEQRFSDDTFFGVEYTLDEEDMERWWTRDALRKANPNFGVSVQADALLARAKKARHTPAATAAFLTKRCNVWTNTDSPWLSVENWDACRQTGLRLEDCAGLPCRISADLARVRDISSVVLQFDLPDGRVAVFARHYMPSATIEASPIAQIGAWVAEGHLIETEGNIVDYLRLEDDIVQWYEDFGASEIVFDEALASRMMQNLQRRLDDTEGEIVIVLPQNPQTIGPAMSLMEEMVLGQRLSHTGDPVLAWMVSNVVAHQNYKEQVTPRKLGGKDSPNKIDGAMATMYALARRLAPEDEDPGPSSLETDGILALDEL